MQCGGERDGLTKFATMQNHYSLLYREEEREMIPYCRSEGMGIIPWSPLARGLLAGSRKAATTRSGTDTIAKKMYTSDADEKVVDRVAEVAARRGVPPARSEERRVGK